MLYVMYLILIASLTGIFMGLYQLIFRKELETKKRLAELSELTMDTKQTSENVVKTPLQKALDLPLHRRVIYPFLKRLTNSLEKRLPNKILITLEKEVVAAGLSHSISFREVLVAYFLIMCAAIVLGIILFVFFSVPIFFIMGLLIAAFLVPRLWLTNKVKKRKDDIEKELPEFLDLLTVSVEAGLGFESSLKRIADEGKGPLSVEIKRVISEISMGKSRKDALIDLKNRIEHADLTSFVNSMVQAEQLGTSISNVLKVESREFRRKRRQRAEEQAMKAPIKLLIPLVFFIFPTIFVILLGPAVLRIMDTLLTI